MPLGSLKKHPETFLNLSIDLHPQANTPRAQGLKRIAADLDDFASVYTLPGNFVLLPTRAMKHPRKRIVQSRMDMTISESFFSGSFAQFFCGPDHVERWVNEQNLSMFFHDDQFGCDNVN